MLKELEQLMGDDTAGNPMSTLKWVRKSTYAISKELSAATNYALGSSFVGLGGLTCLGFALAWARLNTAGWV